MASLKGLTVPTILVADDNSNIQKMVSLVFKEKGIDVVAVGNGEAACRKVPEVRPDVVLADVFMPVRNGYEVCEFVKQDPQFAETPVILLVGAFDPLDEKEAQRVGANGVLKKPFVPPDPLITMVSSLLKLEPPAEEPKPAPAPQQYWTPQNAQKSATTTRQRAIESAQAQYAGSEGDDAVTTSRAPVAAPSSQAQEIEEEDSDPASEWAKRRATMDYEIDAADSADMVEKLAAQGGSDEAEIQAASRRLPFGGANVPEGMEEPGSKSSPMPSLEHETKLSAEPPPSSGQHPELAEEFSLPSPVKEQESSAYADQDSALEFAGSEVEPLPSSLRVRPPEEIEVPQEQPATANSATTDAMLDVAPLTETDVAETSAETPSPYIGESLEPFSEADANPPVLEEGLAPDSFASVPQPPSRVSMEAQADAVPEESAAQSVAPIPSGAEEPSSTKPVDKATVDDVVAKVISKIEPQLHEALANGVLRPLVEELLNQQREKK